jgi:hypothetical protein
MRIRLPQFCVYWAPQGTDKFGKPTLGEPVQLSCRWVEAMTETISKDATAVVARSRVTLRDRVEAGGWLMLGTLDDVAASSFRPTVKANGGAHEIVNVSTTPNLKATQFVTTALVT